MAKKPALIDAWIQPWTKEDVVGRMPEHRRNAYMQKKYGQDERKSAGIPIPQMIDEMDAAGIDYALISAGPMVPMRPVLEVLDKYPDRFAGIAWADPTDKGILPAMRELEAYKRSHHIVGYRLEPFLLQRKPTDRIFYPIYAKCVELDIALATQVGGTMPLYPSGTGDPILIDEIALDFPELRIVCGHVGTPWTDVMIHVAGKHENVYIDTSARLPKHFEPEFVKFLKSYGSDKCIFATDWPILPFDRPLEQVREMKLSVEVSQQFLVDNAIRAFKLDFL